MDSTKSLIRNNDNKHSQIVSSRIPTGGRSKRVHIAYVKLCSSLNTCTFNVIESNLIRLLDCETTLNSNKKNISVIAKAINISYTRS